MKTPQVSVITAVKDPNSLFIVDAYNSLLQQKVTWEWLIQVDGGVINLPEHVTQDKRVKLQINDKTYGPAISRNRALERSKAAIIQNLDGDDYLLPGSLDAMHEQIHTNKYAFVFGKDVSLLADGTEKGEYLGGLKPGPIRPGLIYERWQTMQRLPVHPAGVMWRKDILLTYGGWYALSSGEDTAVIMAASVNHLTFFLDKDTFIYRVHDKQLTAQTSYKTMKAANWSFIKQSIDAMLQSRSSSKISR